MILVVCPFNHTYHKKSASMPFPIIRVACKLFFVTYVPCPYISCTSTIIHSTVAFPQRLRNKEIRYQFRKSAFSVNSLEILNYCEVY